MQSDLDLFTEQTEEDLAADRERAKLVRRANDLDGRTWTRYSISIWSDIRKTPEEIALGHPAIFPQQLVTRLIECFTRSDEKVILDPFMGSGSTIVAADRMGKTGIGFETSAEYYNLAARRLYNRELFQTSELTSQLYLADARRMLEFLKPESVDLVITSPPYWDVLSQKRTADYKETRDYGNAPGDLSQIADYKEFLKELSKVFEKVYQVLKPSKYCIVIVMDLRKKDRFYPFHSDIADFMQEIGFIYDDIIIWDRRHEYNNMRPLGYPSVFRINKAHEYILIFKKP
jgi:DNA modification methylase